MENKHPINSQGSSNVDTNAAGSSTSHGPSEGLLADYLQENMHLLDEGKMFAVVPLPHCPHLHSVESVPTTGLNINAPCVTCKATVENWICLTCYMVGCGRHASGHMQEHGLSSGHPLTLSFLDLSVWCYQCDAYVDNEILYPAKSAAHRCKFSTEMPWSY